MSGRIAGFIAGVTATVLVGAAAVTAAVGIPDSNGVIHACLATTTGQVRIVADDSQCKRNEAALSWNQEGPEGKQGPAGESADMDPLLDQMVTLDARLETLEDQVAALAFRVDELTGGDPVADSDGDGYPDESDVCPNVPHTADLDGDCIPDEVDSDPNLPPACDDGDPLTIDAWDGANGTCVHEWSPDETENIGPYGSDVGECVPGVMNFTTDEILVEAVGPTAEVHDGLDNDCDGAIDEGFESPRDTDSDGVADADDNCPTIANPDQKSTLWQGLGDACVGFSGTDVGACEFGVIDMNTGQLLFAGVGPAVEVFNGVDDDCDGQVDEG